MTALWTNTECDMYWDEVGDKQEVKEWVLDRLDINVSISIGDVMYVATLYDMAITGHHFLM